MMTVVYVYQIYKHFEERIGGNSSSLLVKDCLSSKEHQNIRSSQENSRILFQEIDMHPDNFFTRAFEQEGQQNFQRAMRFPSLTHRGSVVIKENKRLFYHSNKGSVDSTNRMKSSGNFLRNSILTHDFKASVRTSGRSCMDAVFQQKRLMKIFCGYMYPSTHFFSKKNLFRSGHPFCHPVYAKVTNANKDTCIIK